MRVLSWNVAVRRACEAQADAIASLEPDVVVLQEVSRASWPRLCAALAANGLYHNVAGCDEMESGAGTGLQRFVGIVSRVPLHDTAAVQAPLPGTAVAVRLATDGGDVDLIGVYMPIAQRMERQLKIATQEALHERLLEPGHPTIVCGDFNSPKAELADGTVLPFARARNARARLAEERLMGSTTAAGLRDVYRAVWGYDRQESSWYWKNRGRTGGFRLDHIFASPSLVADRCEYVHDFRTRGLSDHSPIFADFPGLQLA